MAYSDIGKMATSS